MRKPINLDTKYDNNSMQSKYLKFSITMLIILMLATAVALAGSQGGAVLVTGMPVFALCCALALLVNWVAFIPANLYQTEKYYDLTGSLTYILVILVAVLLSDKLDTRAVLAAVMVLVWTIRLGSFLFARIKKDGKDSRFDTIKTAPLRFFITWTLQGLWVMLTLACALAIITNETRLPLEWLGYVGIAVWVFGFTVEVVADRQKSAFKANPENEGRFISSGLWSWSRHPNYFGEMVLWFGMALLAVPVLSGWQWVCLISPIFVFVLINYISGVNKLEQAADKKWGDNADYQAYKKRTSVLLLKPPRN